MPISIFFHSLNITCNTFLMSFISICVAGGDGAEVESTFVPKCVKHKENPWTSTKWQDIHSHSLIVSLSEKYGDSR